MFEIQIFIPIADNNGVVFENEHHKVFENFVVQNFGGLSLYLDGKASVVGIWKDDSTTYNDNIRIYGIAIGSIAQGCEIKSLIEFAKAHYSQEAIFIRYLGQAEIL